MAAIVARTFPGSGIPTGLLERLDLEELLMNAELAKFVLDIEEAAAGGKGRHAGYAGQSLKQEIMARRRRQKWFG